MAKILGQKQAKAAAWINDTIVLRAEEPFEYTQKSTGKKITARRFKGSFQLPNGAGICVVELLEKYKVPIVVTKPVKDNPDKTEDLIFANVAYKGGMI